MTLNHALACYRESGLRCVATPYMEFVFHVMIRHSHWWDRLWVWFVLMSQPRHLLGLLSKDHPILPWHVYHVGLRILYLEPMKFPPLAPSRWGHLSGFPPAPFPLQLLPFYAEGTVLFCRMLAEVHHCKTTKVQELGFQVYEMVLGA